MCLNPLRGGAFPFNECLPFPPFPPFPTLFSPKGPWDRIVIKLRVTTLGMRLESRLGELSLNRPNPDRTASWR